MGDQLVGCGRQARPQRHEGGHVFTQLGVGHADDGGFGDRGVREEHRLHLRREHRVPAAEDPLALAADDGDETVGVHRGEVAGAEPSVHENLARLLRSIHVALHRGRALDQELARLAVRQMAAGVVDDPNLDARHGSADRVWRFDRVHRLIRDRAEELRHPVAADDPDAGARTPLLRQIPRTRRRARDPEAHRREVCGGEVGVQEPAEHRRDAWKDRDAMAADCLDDRLGRETLHQSHGTADEQRSEEGSVQAEGVCERKRSQHDIG